VHIFDDARVTPGVVTSFPQEGGLRVVASGYQVGYGQFVSENEFHCAKWKAASQRSSLLWPDPWFSLSPRQLPEEP